MTWERRLNETPPAPTKKLSTDSTSEASPETVVQPSRIEAILDRIVGSLPPLVSAQ
jgi:hypothetical protein